MDSVLLVSSTEKDISVIMEMLNQNSYTEIVAVQNCGEARRLLLDRSFDLCIINTPLPDEFGQTLAMDIVSASISQVILVVKSELYEEISLKVESLGVFTISKPMDKQLFWSALKLANASYSKMTLLKNENNRLLQKIEDVRVIDRAKCILIQYLKMTEVEAHKYIEKQAMDMRITKKTVAQHILKTYES
jgi:two-component system, response regulator PdtaR